MLGNGPVMMSAMGKMWSESPEDVKDFFRHAAQVHNADQQQQQQQHNSEKARDFFDMLSRGKKRGTGVLFCFLWYLISIIN